MNDTRASISSPIRMHQYCSHVRGRMKSSWWEKYRTCPPRSMWRRARAIVRPLFRFFIASDQNWIMQWTRAGGSGSASRSKSSEHHLSVHMEERYTHIYIYTYIDTLYIKCLGIQVYVYQRRRFVLYTYMRKIRCIFFSHNAKVARCVENIDFRRVRKLAFNSPRETDGRNCSRSAFKADCMSIVIG